MNVGLRRVLHQHRVAKPSHELEIVECAERACLCHIDGREGFLAVFPSFNFAGEAFDEVIGIVNSVVECLPTVLHIAVGGGECVARQVSPRIRGASLHLRLICSEGEVE